MTASTITLHFYEKPGCGGNARQKGWLSAEGYALQVGNLLSEPWTAERLRAFFGTRPVADWFNRAAPAVKSGDVVPEALDADHAIALMLAQPLLIRRPLLAVERQGVMHQACGFDTQTFADLGLPLPAALAPQSPQAARSEGCAAHGGAACTPT